MYDDRQYKSGLKNADLLVERYPDHPGNYIKFNVVFRGKFYACFVFE